MVIASVGRKNDGEFFLMEGRITLRSLNFEKSRRSIAVECMSQLWSYRANIYRET